jgi:hypothetical protein
MGLATMTSKLSPKYWDENPEVFIKDLAKRLAIQEPVTCAKIWDAVISMIQWTGSYRDMRRTERQIYQDAMERSSELIKAAINDAIEFFGENAWFFCDRWQLDETVWEKTIERVIKLARHYHKSNLHDRRDKE